jgi:phosphoribosyl-AMP cyclohydrolase
MILFLRNNFEFMKTIELEETQQIELQFDKRGGLLPVAVQETSSGQVLMLASVDKHAFDYTIKNKKAAFFSTSRGKMWVKGETSGNYLDIDEILIDCDQDALVYKVTLVKDGVCHTFNSNNINRKACFYRSVDFLKYTLDFSEK